MTSDELTRFRVASYRVIPMNAIASHAPFRRRMTAAALSALIVALVALVVPALVFYSGNSSTLAGVLVYFACSSFIVFVMLAAAGMLRSYQRWPTRLLFAFIAALVGSVLGAAITTASRTVPSMTLPDQLVARLFATLLEGNLLFVITVLIATQTAGIALWRRVIGKPDAAGRRIALVRAPVAVLAEGQVSHIERSEVDLDLANAQWETYVETLSYAGWEVVEVPIASGYADSVFVEDTMVIFGDMAVIGSPGSESRVGEIVEAENSAKKLQLTIKRIELPGTLDGGDVLKVGTTVYVGRGGRTNAEGIRQLRSLLTPLGYTVVAVPVTKALHLKSTVTALPDGTIIGYAPLVDEPSMYSRFLPMPEAEGAALVVLADDLVLMSSSAPLSAALIADLGYRVILVDIGEFEKLEGCVTCLSVRIR